LHELDQKVEEGSVEISIIHNETVLRGKFPHCREIYIPLAHTYRARLLFDYVYSVHALKQGISIISSIPKTLFRSVITCYGRKNCRRFLIWDILRKGCMRTNSGIPYMREH
jgi:hypothetical protein